MNLTDSPQEAAFRADARSWLHTNRSSAPDVETMPGSADVEAWRTWSRQLYDAGFAGITWPAEFGGRGLGPNFQAIWAEEVATSGVADHLGLVGLGIAGPTIVDHGTNEQRSTLLGPLLRCETVWCQGFSEPGSGSDLASVRTGARREADTWIVDGQKVWSSWAHMADWGLLLVRTDFEAPNHKALTCLLVDMRTPGITVRPLRQLTGDPEFNEVFYDSVQIPVAMTLGDPGDGWRVAMTTLKHERASLGLGLASRLTASVTALVELMNRPNVDGQIPMADEDLRRRLIDVWIEARSLKTLNLRVVSALVESGEPPPFGSLTKLRWSEANQALMNIAVDALGSGAVIADPIGRAGIAWTFQQLRSRGNTIEAGTSEILRNIVAERVLGLPRSR